MIKIINVIKQSLRDARFGYGYEAMWGNGIYGWYIKHFWVLDWTFQQIDYGIRRLICKVKGCNIVDESYGTPERGAMAGHCERCGWGFHHILY
jgi:hypothetical protein